MDDLVLFHSHGIGRFDFSSMSEHDLVELDRLAASRHVWLCPTIYLKRENLGSVRALLSAHAARVAAGVHSRVLGFSLEGPLLGPRGGTPTGSVWQPNAREWQEIVSWFTLGLTYIVVAPDALGLDDEISDGLTMGDLVDGIYLAGGRIAVGHFEGSSAERGAERLERLLTHVERRCVRHPYLLLTDHLFNDMPRNFRHAFRSSAEIKLRASELERVLSVEWEPQALPEILGPVPAALLAAAKQERLTPAINFDGGHVDLAICQRVVSYLGASRLIAMTDHIETRNLAGEPLAVRDGTSLLYRKDGVLAASAVDQEHQLANMREIGLEESSIEQLFIRTPRLALEYVPKPLPTNVRVDES